MNLSQLNKNKWILRIANSLFIWMILMILSLFIVMNRYSDYEEVSENMKRIIVDLDSPYIIGGIILTIGLLTMAVSKLLKANLFVLIIGILTLVIYYSKMLITGI